MSTSYGSSPADHGCFERQAAAEDQTSTRSGRDTKLDKHGVVARENEQFGGIKVGSAFFGWLTATGGLAHLSHRTAP